MSDANLVDELLLNNIDVRDIVKIADGVASFFDNRKLRALRRNLYVYMRVILTDFPETPFCKGLEQVRLGGLTSLRPHF